MNADHVKEWTNDLRTTTAAQTTGYLAVGAAGQVAYCCLGRGEVVRGAQPEGHVFDGALATWGFLDWLGLDMTEHDTLVHDTHPPEGGCICDFDLCLPGTEVFTEDRRPVTAAGLNDDGVTFAQIADLVDHFGVEVVL